MELAEMGYGIAQLNLALLLEKYPLFDSSRTMLSEIASSKLIPASARERHNLVREMDVKLEGFYQMPLKLGGGFDINK